MALSRLSLAVSEAALPPTGRIALVEPQSAADVSALPQDRLIIVSRHATQHKALSAFECHKEIPDACTSVLICLPREKALAQDLIATACERNPDALILIDGQKTDGIDAIFKACRKRTEVLGQITKAHGRAFWFAADRSFEDWQATPRNISGFTTRAGVFSADGIDPASELLVRHLPANPGPAVADLGAGWGYLAHAMLQRPQIKTLHLVENDAIALTCAQTNIADARAQFHWEDATRWRAPELLDTIVMNPPFHQGRKGTPELGQAFIANAARNLKPGGQLFVVANRHLPYEASLSGLFAQSSEIAGSRSFKVLQNARPTRRPR